VGDQPRIFISREAFEDEIGRKGKGTQYLSKRNGLGEFKKGKKTV